ncbi:hypothetical protein ACFYNO_19675 [Kitasatospora sp. NPDC006697]|uniref:hypothetical protein n=1 Tax=Kitasatospora sp. NPDC006697 TaxID=3364020 RepID=UPI0036D1E791
MTHWRRISLLLAATLATACHSSGAPGNPTAKATAVLSPYEAKAKLQGMLDDTFEAIVPDMKFREGWPSVTENDQPPGTANVALDRYVMTRVSAAKYGALLGVVERHWKARGYVIESVNADPTMPAIFAQSADGSSLSLRVGYPGNITIGADVNPINSTGNPFGPQPPQPTLPNGNPDILPTIDDPFWSH